MRAVLGLLVLVSTGAVLAGPPCPEPAPNVPAAHASVFDRLRGMFHHDATEKPCASGLTTHPYPFASGTIPPSRNTTYERFGPGWGINAVNGFPGMPSVTLTGSNWW
jgi:hypothetical protein